MMSAEEDAKPAGSLGNQAVLRCKPPQLLHRITSQGAPPCFSPTSDQGAKLLNSGDQAHLVVQSTYFNPGFFVCLFLISNQANTYVHLIPMSFIHSVLGKKKMNMLIYWPLRMPIPLTLLVQTLPLSSPSNSHTSMGLYKYGFWVGKNQGEQRIHCFFLALKSLYKDI